MKTKEEFLVELESWRGTPYRHGVSKRQQGVDCVRFVVSMLEWLSGREANADVVPFNFAAQAAFCETWPAMQVFAWMNDRYPNTVVYRKGKHESLPPIAAGDVIVLEHFPDAPCHMMLGGYNKRIWHANNWSNGGCVSETGMTMTMMERVWCIWRVEAAGSLQ